MKPRKDDVWLVDFGDPVGREQAGRRLVVVVSVNSLNESKAGVVIIVPITRTRRSTQKPLKLSAEKRDHSWRARQAGVFEICGSVGTCYGFAR